MLIAAGDHTSHWRGGKKQGAPNRDRSRHPRQGAHETAQGRRSLSGARSKHCFRDQEPEGSGWRFVWKQKLDARASFQIVRTAASRLWFHRCYSEIEHGLFQRRQYCTTGIGHCHQPLIAAHYHSFRVAEKLPRWNFSQFFADGTAAVPPLCQSEEMKDDGETLHDYESEIKSVV